MSKHKKKKQREISPPPLSKLDIFIYNAIIIAIVLFALLILFGSNYVAEFVGYADENVMLSYSRWTLLFLFPVFCIVVFPILYFFVMGLEEKKPIFGNKNINYFSTTRYSKAEFLFKKKNNPKDKKIKVIVVFILVMVAIICTVFSLFGRNSIYNNGDIKVHSVINTVKKEYLIDNILSVTIEIGEDYTGRGNYRPMCWVRVQTENQKDFNFSLSDAHWTKINIDEKIANISTLKNVFDSNNIPVSVIGEEYIDELIEYYELSETERKLLVDLFNEV